MMSKLVALLVLYSEQYIVHRRIVIYTCNLSFLHQHLPFENILQKYNN